MTGEGTELGVSEGSLSEVVDELSLPAMVKAAIEPPTGDQINQVLYSFYDPEVRRKLLELIKTDTVRLMDKKFMNNLQNRLYQSYSEEFEKRLHRRRLEEEERRRKLAIRGIQDLDDDSSLRDNPMLQVGKKVERELALQKKKRKKTWRRRKTSQWEYLQFQTVSELESSGSEVSLVQPEITDGDWLKAETRRYAKLRQEGLETGQLPPKRIIESLKYEPPMVKELRKLHTVDELYQMAEQILNPWKDEPEEVEAAEEVPSPPQADVTPDPPKE